MRQFILLLCFLTFFLVGKSQTQKLSNDFVWSALYPENNNFDNENMLIREVNRDEGEMEFRTVLKKIFYYKAGQQQKAAVVLFSYDFTSGEAKFCHPCYPEMEIATFNLTGQTWTKQKFVLNWKDATGSWGEGPELQFKILNGINGLVTKFSYGNQGEFHDYTDYYNIETLKKVKSITK